MSNTLRIHGGQKLSGVVTPIPNKNAILAVLPACILTDQPFIYKNMPDTSDVRKMLLLLKLLGAEVDDSDYNNISVNCKNISTNIVDEEIGKTLRTSILFVGPLLARFGRATVPVPGGCVLGARSIAAHIDVFIKMGVSVEFDDTNVTFNAPKSTQKSISIWQNEASVTATENLALYLAGLNMRNDGFLKNKTGTLKTSKVVVINAASEPHVTQLLQVLSSMGAEVSGVGSNILTFSPSKEGLKGTTYYPEPDYVDIAGYMVAAAVTKGRIVIKDANKFDIVGGLVETFSKFNIAISTINKDLIVDGDVDLKIDLNQSGFPLAGPELPKLKPAPWPGFPVDVIPVMATLASKTPGTLLLQNWMYETGLDFIRELNKMGADIFMSDPQRVIIKGPVMFKGGSIVSPGIIQACKALFLAALADDSVTELAGADVLKRRYPNIVETYNKLGAQIEVLEK